MAEINGLSWGEVESRKKQGLVNSQVKSYAPSYTRIVFNNVFSLVNVIITPLLFLLFAFQYYLEIFAFITYLLVNTVVSTVEELRNRKKLEKLKKEFEVSVLVIRDGAEKEVNVAEVVMGDYIKAQMGESIIADGEVKTQSYLQVDESALTGESDYIKKSEGENLMAGSFIVTGSCIYEVKNVGSQNYLNRLGSQSLQFKRRKSGIERAGDKFILFLVAASIVLGLLNFVFAQHGGVQLNERVLGLSSIISLLIPQTLIFLFTLTFTVATVRLSSKGVLVQNQGTIEELAKADVICMDKTGTITTNELRIVEDRYFNMRQADIAEFYKSVDSRIVGRNKTQQTISEYFKNFRIQEVDQVTQIPFNSREKYSLIQGVMNNEEHAILIGAFGIIKNCINKSTLEEVQHYVHSQEEKGYRVIAGIYHNRLLKKSAEQLKLVDNFTSEKVFVFTVEDSLNPGVAPIIERLMEEGLAVKVISGDSKKSVEKVVNLVGLKSNRIVDLSEADYTDSDFTRLALNYDIFTRARPDDKLKIIKALQHEGHTVGMFGDGINDVLSLKASDIGISMGSGTKITREVSDIVLADNDFSKLPDIFFEGSNIINNMLVTNKLFMAKSILTIIFSLFVTARFSAFPIAPNSLLIFSFIGSSLPSFLIAFTRTRVKAQKGFTKRVFSSAMPAGIIMSLIVIGAYLFGLQIRLDSTQMASMLVILILTLSVGYSLLVIWNSGIVRSFLLIAFLGVVLLGMGIYQTIAPITNANYGIVEIALITCVLFIGVMLAIYYIWKNVTNTKTRKILIGFGVLFGVPLGLFFPFQTWYSVQPVALNLYWVIFALLGVYIFTNLIIQKLFNLEI